MMTTLAGRRDLEWVAAVHYPYATLYAVAVIHGNEDSPSKIELYSRDDCRCKPTVLSDNGFGRLRVVSFGNF
jgi:hypothetical protein